MSPAARVLLGLGLGLVGGGVLAATAPRLVPGIVGAVEPVGALWTNAIRMTVLPLLVASLVVGVAAAPGSETGRLGWRALVVFLLLLGAAALFAALLAPPLLALLPIEPSSAASLRADAAARADVTAAGARELPTFADWLVGLVPANPVKAAADSAMLPVIVFALTFGLALRSSAGAARQPVLLFFAGVADASLVLVGWVLALAPLGVFALALPLATRMGAAAAGAVGSYVVLVSAMIAGFTLALYPVVALVGRVPLARFARAVTPAQAVAFGSRSSLAALPAMMRSAETHLGLPRPVAGFVLPLAVSVFKVALPISITVGALFIARLYGVEVVPAQLATLVLTAVLLSFSAPGIPSGSVLLMVPVFLSVGLPVEGVAILLAVDLVPDVFKTTAHVTADMAAAALVHRRAGRPFHDASSASTTEMAARPAAT